MTTTTYLENIKELSAEDRKKIRAVSANVIATMTMPSPDQLEKDDVKERYDTLTKRLTEAVNKEDDDKMRIVFKEGDNIPPEITSKIIAAYSSVINDALLQRRKEISNKTRSPYGLPMNCRYYSILYKTVLDEGHERVWAEDMSAKGMRKEALPLKIIIRCEALTHTPPHLAVRIGRRGYFEHIIYLYNYEYDDELLSKADQIYAEIITWRTLIRPKNNERASE
ncbi:MAG: hypothetical protein QXM92_03230 [Candidatus Anstonellales archaeon]